MLVTTLSLIAGLGISMILLTGFSTFLTLTMVAGMTTFFLMISVMDCLTFITSAGFFLIALANCLILLSLTTSTCFLNCSEAVIASCLSIIFIGSSTLTVSMTLKLS